MTEFASHNAMYPERQYASTNLEHPTQGIDPDTTLDVGSEVLPPPHLRGPVEHGGGVYESHASNVPIARHATETTWGRGAPAMLPTVPADTPERRAIVGTVYSGHR
jgi:hypothetical protein